MGAAVLDGRYAIANDSVDAALEAAHGMFQTPRMIEATTTDAVSGDVVWQPHKSLWITAMTLVAVIAGPLTVTWGALALFIVTSAVTVCLGHSPGMHRRLIHRSFACRLWPERSFVYLGTLVGMAGPFGMIRQHDIRDWAQRRSACLPYLAHRTRLTQDAWWQLHCDIRLAHPQHLQLEQSVAEDRHAGARYQGAGRGALIVQN